MTTTRTIRTPAGGKISPRQYVERVCRLKFAEPCEYGHFGCAAWDGGPCSDEQAHLIPPDEDDPREEDRR